MSKEVTKELIETVRQQAGGAVETAVARNMPLIIASIMRQITASGGWCGDDYSTDVAIRIAFSWVGGFRVRVRVRAVKWQTRQQHSDTDFEWLTIDLQQPDIPGLLSPADSGSAEDRVAAQVDVEDDPYRSLRAISMRNLMAAAENMSLKIYRPCLDPSVPNAERCLELYECCQGEWSWRSSIVPEGGREKILKIAEDSGSLVIGLDGELGEESAKRLILADYSVMKLSKEGVLRSGVVMRMNRDLDWYEASCYGEGGEHYLKYIGTVLADGGIFTQFNSARWVDLHASA